MQQPTPPVFASEADVTAYVHSPAFKADPFLRRAYLELIGEPIITKMEFHPLTLEQDLSCKVELAGTFIFHPDPRRWWQENRQPYTQTRLSMTFDCQSGELRGMQAVDERPKSGPPVFATEEDVRKHLSSRPFGIHRIQGEGIPTIESLEMKGGRCRVVLSGLFWFVAPHFTEQQSAPRQSRVGVVFDCQNGCPIEAGFL